jgi:hypothetical protein
MTRASHAVLEAVVLSVIAAMAITIVVLVAG